jgi:hypothetical protein
MCFDTNLSFSDVWANLSSMQFANVIRNVGQSLQWHLRSRQTNRTEWNERGRRISYYEICKATCKRLWRNWSLSTPRYWPGVCLQSLRKTTNDLIRYVRYLSGETTITSSADPSLSKYWIFFSMARQPYMCLGLLVSSRLHDHTH